MSANKRIFLIDDDFTTSTLNKMIIERSELVDEIVVFTSAISALDFLKKEEESEHSDLILLDLNMPVMDGWEFVDAYRDRTKNTEQTIVVLSSSIDPNDISRAEAEPAIAEFQSKPLSPDTLSQLVGKYLI